MVAAFSYQQAKINEAPMHYYQFNIADFALHTSHLTLEEEAVYRRLLDYYYDTEKPIPKETQPVIRRLRLGNYSDIVGLILQEFFTLEDDGWHNSRCDIELKSYHAKAETARANGKKGGRPPKNKGPETQPVFLANPAESESKANHKPLTINQEPITNNQELLTNNHKLITNNQELTTNVKSISSPAAPDPADDVIDYWRKVMGKDNSTKATRGRLDKIRARLKDGYTPEQIKQAIDGCRRSDYHMGKNDQGKRYDCLTLICRSAEKMEQFIGYNHTQSPDDIREREVMDWVNGNDFAGRLFEHE
jgi:uncharacterized protein YdaU (DUF1376 family)